MKYRPKQAVIDAFKLGMDPIPDWFMNKVTTNEIILRSGGMFKLDCAEIMSPDGDGFERAEFADMVILGAGGRVFPCPYDVFTEVYEAADE